MRHVFISIALLVSVSVAPSASAGLSSDLAAWYVLPAVASSPGANGTYFRTNVTLVNPYVYHSLEIGIRLLKNGQDNTSSPSATVNLRPGETVLLKDIVSSLFGFTGGGALILSSSDGFAFACSSWTSTGTSGTYGFAGSGHDWTYWGTAETFLPGLRNGGGFRTNVGLVSTSAVETTVEVNIYDSTQKLGTRQVTLPPFGRTQFSVSEIAPEFENAYAIVTGVTANPDTSWLPFATVIDNTSGDSVYIGDLFDDVYSVRQAQYDLSGVWSGSLTWTTRTQTVIADVYQAGTRVDFWLYDKDSGAMLFYVSGFEDKGSLSLSGRGAQFQCLSSDVTVDGKAVDAKNLTLSTHGADCFAGAGAISLRQVGPHSGLEARGAGAGSAARPASRRLEPRALAAGPVAPGR